MGFIPRSELFPFNNVFVLFTVGANDIRVDQNQSNEVVRMGSLDPRWLSVELDSIDATIKTWTPALCDSYEAALRAFADATGTSVNFPQIHGDLEKRVALNP
jgi:hypothetical protein